MTEETTTGSTLAGRLRQRLRSFEPMYLALLGLLSIPGHLFDSLAFLQPFGLFFLAFLWPFVAPLVDAVLRRGTDADVDETAEPTDWIHTGSWREYAAWLLVLPVTFLNPLVLAQDVMQLVGSAVAVARHRGSVPDAESYEQRVSYRLPFEGAWTVVNGSHEKDYSHSWFPVNQRYAYDFVITDADGRTRPDGAPATVDDCYDEPILAPADGVVVDVFDGDLESARAGGLSHPLKRDIRGNYVVVQHAADEYSCLAHLVPGSVTVDPGDRVDRGQEIGRCGHSGNSSEPHLHFQVQDHPDFEIAASLPVAFDDVALEWPDVEVPITEPLLDERDAIDARDPDDPDYGSATDASIAAANVAGLEDGTYRTRAYVSAGQRVAHVGGDGDPVRERGTARDTPPAVDDAEIGRPSTGRHTGTAALQRVGFGACVGGVAAFVWPIFLAPLTVAALLGAAAVVAVAYRVGAAVLGRNGDDRHRVSSGAVVGVAIAAAVVAWYARTEPALGIGAQTLGLGLLLLGFVGYAVVGEYDRRQLGDSFRDSAGLRPS